MNVIKQGLDLTETQDYEELSKICADVMVECVRKKPDSLFCLATGSSPTRAYQIFVDRINKEHINVQKLRILKLDEWWRIDKNDPSTCEDFIQIKIIKPLNIPAENYISFNSDAPDADVECNRIAEIIQVEGPIDLSILGIGKNGHLGLNEPDAYFIPFPHVVELDEKTKTHSMLTKTNVTINYGMTLGMADIIASRKIILLVTGSDKNKSFKVFLKAQVRSDLPASILWLHPNVLCLFESKLI